MQNSTGLTGRLRSGEWLDRPLMTFTALLMIAGTVLGLGALFFTAKGTLDVFGRPLGTDFSSFWTAGRMALEGHAAQAYDWVAHQAMQHRIHGTEEYFPWSYPPLFLLVAAAAAALPYLPALALWQSLSAAAAGLAFWKILPSRHALMLALGFPGVLLCLGHGQTGFLTAALLAGGVLALPRHEIWAGVMFGLLAYKPQFGLLIPLVLVAGGYWRAIAAAAVTVLAAVAVTLVIWGWPVWQAFLDAMPLTRGIAFEQGSTGFHKFQSIFAWVRLWGGPVGLAYGAQAAVTLASALGCVWVWRSGASHALKGAALLTGALLSTPYVLDYDFVVFGLGLAFLATHAIEHGFRPWEKTLLAFAWFVPVAARGIAQITFIPLGFITLAAVFAWTVLRASEEAVGVAKATAAPARG